MQEQLANIGPGDKPYAQKWLDAAGWSAYHAMDGFLSKAIFEAGVEGRAGGAAPDAAQRPGDDGVSTMMPPLNLAEQSSFARDRGVIGSLILVRNFPNTLYNVGARAGVGRAQPGLGGRSRLAEGEGRARARTARLRRRTSARSGRAHPRALPDGPRQGSTTRRQASGSSGGALGAVLPGALGVRRGEPVAEAAVTARR
jgi:hypothetical protein